MIEDLALLNVIKEIDSRLPAYIKQFYSHKMKDDEIALSDVLACKTTKRNLNKS